MEAGDEASEDVGGIGDFGATCDEDDTAGGR